MTRLKTETNTERMHDRVLQAAEAQLELDADDLQVDYEHGQHWVTHRPSGAQWSVVDAEGPGSCDGFRFEQVSAPDWNSFRDQTGSGWQFIPEDQ